MTLQKIEFEYDIPDGYRFVRYGNPKKGDKCLVNNEQIIIAEYNYDCGWIIVEKIPEQEQQKLKLQYKTQQGYWRDVIDGYEYRIKPKTKIVRFRNFLHSIGIIMATDEDVSIADFFKQWLGDWQQAEIEDND